ncbi:hypothetical protein COB87_000805 [Candidatus Wolfebacteria bacterium]|nr:hypothetical protein [Candidatus Wolfebacteria bacterium]
MTKLNEEVLIEVSVFAGEFTLTRYTQQNQKSDLFEVMICLKVKIRNEDEEDEETETDVPLTIWKKLTAVKL